MQIAIAVRNLARAAVRDPLWAIVAILISPFLMWRTVAVAIAACIAVAFAGSWLSHRALLWAEIPHNSQVRGWTGFAVWMLCLAVTARMLLRPFLDRFGGLAESDTHGSARFATSKEIRPLMRPAGLLIGRDMKSGKLLRYDGPAHLLTIAPTRSGKGVGTIIPNLLDSPGSVICIDPKGENARLTATARRRFGTVHVLDPFGATDEVSAAFNPLDRIDPNALDLADDCMTLADALVYDPPGEAGEAHWNEEAKALIAGLILHIARFARGPARSLAMLREYLTLPPDSFVRLLEAMQQAGGLTARAANRHLGKSDREAAGVLSAAQRHTHFLDSPRMTRVLGRSDFAFADLKAGTVTIFLVLPPDRLATYARWLRLMVAQGLTDLVRAPGSLARPVLMLMDEFAALGRLEPVERAMGLMAGYGIQLWPILQDIHQLRALYDKRAGTFLSNAGVLQVFGTNDQESAKMISDLLGQETITFQTVSRSLDAEGSGLTYAEHHHGRPLLTADEVRTLPASKQLLFLTGERPILAHKLKYFEDREFRYAAFA